MLLVSSDASVACVKGHPHSISTAHLLRGSSPTAYMTSGCSGLHLATATSRRSKPDAARGSCGTWRGNRGGIRQAGRQAGIHTASEIIIIKGFVTPNVELTAKAPNIITMTVQYRGFVSVFTRGSTLGSTLQGSGILD